MSVPGIVHSTLDGEEIAARVSLGGEDELFITSSSTLVYRSDGLLRDESVDEYPHEADRLTLSEGRRKTTFTLEYSLEGTREFTVPSGKTDAVLHPVLAGVLNGNGITNAGETVVQTYRFSELTLIITSERLVKHIGSAVWDDDYEEYHFDDVTNLAFEDGSVATQIVLTVDGRPQRIKAPNEEANDLRERLKRALFDYHDVGSLEELNETIGGDEEPDDEDSGSTMEFGTGVDPLDADPPEPDDHEIERAAGDVEAADATATDAAEAGAGAGAGADADADSAIPDSIDAQRTRDEDRTRDRAQESTRGESAQDAADPLAESPDANREFEPADPEPSSDPADPGQSIGTDPTSEPVDTGVDESTDATAADADTGAGAQFESPAESRTRSDAQSGGTAAETADVELLERIESLEATVERQNDLLEQQQETIDQLIEELRRGR